MPLASRRPKAGRWVLELDLDTLLGAEVRAEDPNASVGSPRMARLRHDQAAEDRWAREARAVGWLVSRRRP